MSKAPLSPHQAFMEELKGVDGIKSDRVRRIAGKFASLCVLAPGVFFAGASMVVQHNGAQIQINNLQQPESVKEVARIEDGVIEAIEGFMVGEGAFVLGAYVGTGLIAQGIKAGVIDGISLQDQPANQFVTDT